MCFNQLDTLNQLKRNTFTQPLSSVLNLGISNEAVNGEMGFFDRGAFKITSVCVDIVNKFRSTYMQVYIFSS